MKRHPLALGITLFVGTPLLNRPEIFLVRTCLKIDQADSIPILPASGSHEF